MTGGQANFLQSLGWAVLNSLWQMALLWVIYQVIISVHRKGNAGFRSSLATLLLITGFGWFLYTFLFTWLGSAGAGTFHLAVLDTAGNATVSEGLEKLLPVASLTYLLLLIVPVLRFIRNYRYVQVIRKYGLTKMNAQWRVFVNKVAAQMGIRKKVQIWVSELVSSPVTIGFLKPVILVPLAAINHLSPQQLEAVLLHELSHIRRFDYLVNLLINCIRTLLYFNPFVRAFVKTIEREREQSCDEMVLQFQYNSYEYATALLTLEKVKHTPQTLFIGATGNQSDLVSRVELILGTGKKHGFSRRKMTGMLAGLFCILAINALILFGKPVTGFLTSLFDSPGRSWTSYPIAAEEPLTETAAAPVINEIKNKQTVINPKTISPAEAAIAPDDPDFITAAHELAALPELKKYQEEQVKEALEASKKVLKESEWKQIEKSMADAFSYREKEKVRSVYEKEIEKLDWEKWENKLKGAYEQIDWNKVNDQLSKAMNQLTIDSLNRIYSIAARELEQLARELRTENLKGVPDTDITLQEITGQKEQVQKALNTLRALRSKKIVRL
jgi:beta-lactamase regulating signal transducer with metallopeptidase domain